MPRVALFAKVPNDGIVEDSVCWMRRY